MAETVETIRIEQDTSDLEKAARSVRQLETEMTDLERTMRAMGQASSVDMKGIKALGDQLQQTRNRAAQARQEFQRLGGTNALRAEQQAKPEAPAGLTAAGGLEAASTAAAGAALALVAAAAALTAAGASLAIKSSAFHEDTVVAFENIVGTRKEAEALFKEADELAGRLGLEDDAVVAQLRKLMTSGFKADTALGAVKAAADLAAARGGEASDAFTSMLATLEAKGKFDTRALNQLAKMGVRTEDVFASLAQKMGKSTVEVAAMVKAGTIDTQTAVDAIIETITKKYGGAGEKAAQTFTRLLFRAKDAFEDLFNSVDLSPLSNALKAVLAALDGPGGKRMREGIEKIFGGLFDALFGAFDAGRIDAIIGIVADAFNMIGDTIKSVAPAVKEFIGGLIDGFADAWPMMKLAGEAMLGVLKALGSMPGFWKMVGYGLALVVGLVAALVGGLNALAMLFIAVFVVPIAAVIAAIGALVSALGSLWDALGIGPYIEAAMSAIGGLASMMWEAGANIVSSIASGIAGGAGAVYDAVVGVAKGVYAAFMSAIGAHSPSRLFKFAGGTMPAGTVEGVREGIPDVKRAVNDMASAAAAANDNAGGAPKPASAPVAGPTYVTVQHASPPVNVPEGATPAEAQALARAVNAGDQEKFNEMLLVALRTVRAA